MVTFDLLVVAILGAVLWAWGYQVGLNKSIQALDKAQELLTLSQQQLDDAKEWDARGSAQLEEAKTLLSEAKTIHGARP